MWGLATDSHIRTLDLLTILLSITGEWPAGLDVFDQLTGIFMANSPAGMILYYLCVSR